MKPKQQKLTIARALQMGVEHHRAGRLKEAEGVYLQVLKAAPGNPDALHLLGAIAHQAGKHEAALEWIDQALRSQPENPVLLINRGNILQRLRRYEDAIASYDKVLAVRPDHAGVLADRGNALLVLGRCEQALASYARALAITPDSFVALSNRGNALQDLGRYEEALASYDGALALKPGYAEALNNRGLVLKALKRHEEALGSYDQALAIKPDYVQALSNRGLVLEALNRYAESLASYDRALALDPGHAEALSNRGNALKALGRYGEALASFDRALAIAPDYAEAHWNESLCRLLMGDFERGWKEYEWRWKWKHFTSARRTFSQPLWLGREDVAGKTILLHAEQGLGDTIQFCRYAKFVAGRGATVLLQVQPQLQALLGGLEGVGRTLAFGEAVPDFDFHCPLMSLPLALGTRLDTVPCGIPYLFVEPRNRAAWESRLGPKRAPRIGLAWSGNPSHDNEPNRSVPLAMLLDAIPAGVELYSLQKEVRPADQAVLDRRPDILHFGENFVETAALAMCMDLVISVDTSIVHLAGALGRPVWLLLSASLDWRWLLEREDSPWYPTARLYRQGRAGDWAGVLERLRGDLSRWAEPGTETA